MHLRHLAVSGFLRWFLEKRGRPFVFAQMQQVSSVTCWGAQVMQVVFGLAKVRPAGA